MKRLILIPLACLCCAILGAGLSIVGLAVVVLNDRPDLQIWHTVHLDAEFTADAGIDDFPGYLRQEEKLFAQLEREIRQRIPPENRSRINRFCAGSLADPEHFRPNWNRTFELIPDTPRSGALLLHGMSDSPYSLRAVAQRLHRAGVHVIGLRLPGHGTAPSGLLHTTWEDMAAAVRLTLRHLNAEMGERPISIVGYSNGAALAVRYALSAIEDPDLPRIQRLVLISPAIGVTPMAAMAAWQARMGRLPGLEKLLWNDILPEYDPFKYGSFAVNAGDQVYRLTSHIRAHMEALSRAGRLTDFPPTLALQSVADATVSTRAVTNILFSNLPANGHELLLFDINRHSEVERLLTRDPAAPVTQWMETAPPTCTISLITNRNASGRRLMLRRTTPGAQSSTETPLEMDWPEGLFSLSHVALPFPPSDPVYGRSGTGTPGIIHLGSLNLRGERGVLQIPADAMLRLRWNPFYPFLEDRLAAFLTAVPPATP